MKQLGAVCLAALIGGCGTPSTAGDGQGSLQISRNDVKSFEATFTMKDGTWAHTLVEYTPTTTLFKIDTSFNTTLVRNGTAPAPSDWVPDPRSHDGYLALTNQDAELPVMNAMHAAIMKMGVTDQPTPAQKGSPLYAAAYITADVLGIVATINAPTLAKDELPKFWPYPGYDDVKLLPPELMVQTGEQSFLNGSCCGPTNCYTCNWPGTASCDDWCAAGDHCNAYHGSSGCGSICPGISCPHSNSGAIKAAGNAWQYCANHTNYWSYNPYY
jgi:hypothetical protein